MIEVKAFKLQAQIKNTSSAPRLLVDLSAAQRRDQIYWLILKCFEQQEIIASSELSYKDVSSLKFTEDMMT